MFASAKPLRHLLTLSLEHNELRCDGVAALAPSLSEDVLPQLRTLHLHANRIGDAGAAALCGARMAKLMVCMLQENEIGDDGVLALGRAVGDESLRVKSLNLLGNRFSFGAADEFKKLTTKKFVDVKLPTIPTARERMAGGG